MAVIKRKDGEKHETHSAALAIAEFRRILEVESAALAHANKKFHVIWRC